MNTMQPPQVRSKKRDLRAQYRFYAHSITSIMQQYKSMDSETRRRAIQTIENIRARQRELENQLIGKKGKKREIH